MRHTVLGKSRLDVSRVAFGTWQLGADWGPTDTAAATKAIRRAADKGVTFFDTAQAMASAGRSSFWAPRPEGLTLEEIEREMA